MDLILTIFDVAISGNLADAEAPARLRAICAFMALAISASLAAFAGLAFRNVRRAIGL